MVKKFEDICISFDRMYESDRHTDRQTPHDGIRIGRTCIASRGKNSSWSTWQCYSYKCLPFCHWHLIVLFTGAKVQFWEFYAQNLGERYSYPRKVASLLGMTHFEPTLVQIGRHVQQHCVYIQGGPKKLHTELMAITLSILKGFSKFFHCWKAK